MLRQRPKVQRAVNRVKKTGGQEDRGGVLHSNTHKGEATPSYKIVSAITYTIQVMSAIPMVPPRIEVMV